MGGGSVDLIKLPCDDDRNSNTFDRMDSQNSLDRMSINSALFRTHSVLKRTSGDGN